MKQIKENVSLKKFKQELERNGEITLKVPANNLKILLEVKYRMKLKLIDKFTICYEKTMR